MNTVTLDGYERIITDPWYLRMEAAIREAEHLVFYLASQELRASRGHLPGEHQERYWQLRAHAREIDRRIVDMCQSLIRLGPTSFILQKRNT